MRTRLIHTVFITVFFTAAMQAQDANSSYFFRGSNSYNTIESSGHSLDGFTRQLHV